MPRGLSASALADSRAGRVIRISGIVTSITCPSTVPKVTTIDLEEPRVHARDVM
jgi:hypothetical protein